MAENKKSESVKKKSEKKAKNGVIILYCGCKGDKEGNTQGAEYQNEVYGQGNRVHNIGSNRVCTVCGGKK